MSQQFQPQYPYQQQQQYAPPPPAPKKRNLFKNKWFWIAIIALVLLSGISAALGGGNNNTSTSTSTPVSTQPVASPTVVPKWTTIHTFSGRTHQKTVLFTITKGWRLSWSCTDSTVPEGATGAVGITAYDRADQQLGDPITGRCPPQDNPTTGTSDIQQYGGTMYLDVYATGTWTVQIQELK